MEYTWDEDKDEANFKKHGVWFQEAVTVFMDPLRDAAEDKDHDEERFITVGISHRLRVLIVAYAYRDDVFRVISARRATPKERERYEKRI